MTGGNLALIQNAWAQLGTVALLLLFMYWRQRRSDKQIDKKDDQILAANKAVMDLSNDAIKTFSESKIAADARDARILALEGRVSELTREKP